MQHIVFFSSGITAWATARRVAATHGTRNLVLLFADTGVEDPDNYRFLHEAAANIGAPLAIVSHGNLFDLWTQKRAIPNNRMAFCSRILKQKPCRQWVASHCDPAHCCLYVGIDWTEIHRIPAIAQGWAPYPTQFPMTDPPYLDKTDTLALARAEGLEPPRLYQLGLPHANCGGACVRAGHGAWRQVLRDLPGVFARWEAEEARIQALTGKTCTILKRSTRGRSQPYSLRELREGVERQPALFDQSDLGPACSCFSQDVP